MLPANSHLPVRIPKSTRGTTDNTKTDIVVAVVGRIIVAIGGTTIPRIVDPGTAAFADLSHFQDTGVRGEEREFRRQKPEVRN